MDIRELVLQLRKYPSDRAVAEKTKTHRQTVKRYRAWAKTQGLLEEGSLPSLAELDKLVQATLPDQQPPQNASSLEPFRGMVMELRRQNVEMAAIWARLSERGFTGSYSAVRRFVHCLEPQKPKEVFVRVECQPGQQAQVDFGYAGRMLDPATGKPRKSWAFVMTLSFSRYQYVEFVFGQTVATWLLCHRHAFEFFGAVPEEVVLDNLKAAIIRACFDDPLVQQSYRECAEHYGFLIAPCRPATPQHKGKVEQGGVHYVKRNFLGGRQPTSILQANQDVRQWSAERGASGATPPPGCASTAQLKTSLWFVFRRSSGPGSSRYRRRPTMRPFGPRSSCPKMATSSLTRLTTPCLWVSRRAPICSCAAVPGRWTSTTCTTKHALQ